MDPRLRKKKERTHSRGSLAHETSLLFPVAVVSVRVHVGREGGRRAAGLTRPRIDNRAITVLRSARHCQYWHYQLSSSEMHLHPNHVAALIVGSMFYEGTGSTKFIRVAQVLLLSFPLVAPRCALLFAIRIPSKAPLPAVINVTRDITRRMKRISRLYIYIYISSSSFRFSSSLFPLHTGVNHYASRFSPGRRRRRRRIGETRTDIRFLFDDGRFAPPSRCAAK